MERETKTISLKDYEIDIKTTQLTWGEKETLKLYYLNGYLDENLKTSSMNPEKLMETRCKRVSYAIIEIRKGEEKIPFSKEWLMNLEYEDGSKLFEEINSIDKEKKNQSLEVK